MKYLMIPLAILVFLLMSCKETTSISGEFELSLNGKKLVEGELQDTIPLSIWNYYDNSGSLMAKKGFYNTKEKVSGQSDLLYFDKDRLVYFGGRFTKSSPGDENWGKTLVSYYCGSCHDTWEESVGPTWSGMADITEENFKKRLTTSAHISKEKLRERKLPQEWRLIHEGNENFAFLTDKDLEQILVYVKELSKSVP